MTAIYESFSWMSFWGVPLVAWIGAFLALAILLTIVQRLLTRRPLNPRLPERASRLNIALRTKLHAPPNVLKDLSRPPPVFSRRPTNTTVNYLEVEEEEEEEHDGARTKLLEFDASTFAPSTMPGGTRFLLQCWLHNPDDYSFVANQAKLADPLTTEHPSLPLISAPTGTEIEIRIDGDGLQIVESDQTIKYFGRPTPVYFLCRIPIFTLKREYFVTVRFFRSGTPVGRTTFCITRGWNRASSREQSSMQPYRTAFLSHASADRVKVLEIAQALKLARTEVFQDVLSLEPGARWQKEIYKRIEDADLFILFWSSAAKHSEWVVKEAEYALKHQKRMRGRRPDIVPLVLEGPPIPTPPKSLAAIHFNDPMRSIITAESTAAIVVQKSARS